VCLLRGKRSEPASDKLQVGSRDGKCGRLARGRHRRKLPRPGVALPAKVPRPALLCRREEDPGQYGVRGAHRGSPQWAGFTTISARAASGVRIATRPHNSQPRET
jgi:hypothetical protein